MRIPDIENPVDISLTKLADCISSPAMVQPRNSPEHAAPLIHIGLDLSSRVQLEFEYSA
jgi:hypothetical protein